MTLANTGCADVSLPRLVLTNCQSAPEEDKAALIASISSQINDTPPHTRITLLGSCQNHCKSLSQLICAFGCQQPASPPKASEGVAIIGPAILSRAKIDFFSHNEAASQRSCDGVLNMYRSACNRRYDLRVGAVAPPQISITYPPLSYYRLLC